MRPGGGRADGATILSYGPAGGYAPLRRWIAEQHGVSQARVVLTNGSLQGFALLAQVMAGGGERVLVEAPTYDRPLRILGSLGAEVDARAVRRGRARRRRARGRAAARAASCIPLRDPDVPEPDRPDALGRAARPSRRARRRARPPRPRGRSVRGRSGSRAKRRRRSSSWTAGSTSPSRARSRRPSHPASASATSSCRSGSRAQWSLRRPRPTSLRRCSHRRPCTSSSAAATWSGTSSSSARSSARGGMRLLAALERAFRRDRRALEPARGRLFPLARPPGRRERAGGPPRRAGSRRVVHRRAGLLSVGRRRAELGEAGLQLRLAGAATGGCPPTGAACLRVACGRAATAARRLGRRTRPSAPSPRSARGSR